MVYDLYVEENTVNINRNKGILISRSAPVAFVVGVAGFVGSHLADQLLAKNIQVIGVDDFSGGFRKNLDQATRDKNFHLISASINDADRLLTDLNLPRLDYAFFVAEKNDQQLYNLGLHNFLQFIKASREHLAEQSQELITQKPKIAFVSSVDLYRHKLSDHQKDIKEAEIKLAKFAKYYKLNARIIRLAGVYGPRMHFNFDDPMIRLIYSSLLGDIQKEDTSTDFSTRAVYIGDAVSLITKSVLSGSTSHKIYDGALPQPIKVAEVKQILLDPMWHEMKHFQPTELPPWMTPNLERTIRELNWKPSTNLIEGIKQTIKYFEKNEIPTLNLAEKVDKQVGTIEQKINGVLDPEKLKRWSFSSYEDESENLSEKLTEGKGESENKKQGSKQKDFKKGEQSKITTIRKKTLLLGALLLILYALILPLTFLVFGAFNIKNHLEQTQSAISLGDFKKAHREVTEASNTLKESKQLIDSLAILKKIGPLESPIDKLDNLVEVVSEGVSGVSHAVYGTEDLFLTTKIISGESNDDPAPNYQNAKLELTTASSEIAKVRANLEDPQFLADYPNFLINNAKDLDAKLGIYLDLIEKGRAAAVLLPEITAVDGKKTYLVLLQNNLELRPGGGFISAYAKLNFEKGKLVNIKVDDTGNLDNNFKDQIAPPVEIKNDLGQDLLLLKDANYEPDFPTSARQAEYLYKREAGESINGVFALNLSGSARLLSAVEGVKLADYGQDVSADDLAEKVITNTQNNNATSDNKKSYIGAVNNQLFNKIFYLSRQNWPKIIEALAANLREKQLMVYLPQPNLFSYLVSQNWAGVLPRGAQSSDGVFADFLAATEANYGNNMANYYLERSYNLDTKINSDQSEINHSLEISYKNNSPSSVFPAGEYKFRFKAYLPLGAKLTRAIWGDTDITTSLETFSDYNRGGYTTLLTLSPKEGKKLVLEYNLSQGLNFKDGKLNYKLDIFKQSGTGSDPFVWTFSYPQTLTVSNIPGRSNSSNHKVFLNTDLSTDKSFSLQLEKP